MTTIPDPIPQDEAEEPATPPSWPVAPRPSLFGERLSALFEVLVCSGYPTQLFIATLLLLLGVRPHSSGQDYSAAFIVSLSLADAVLLVGLVLAFLYLHGERPREVLFGRRAVWREAILGVLLVPAVFVLAILVLATVQQFAPYLHNVPRNPLEALIRDRTSAVLFALVAIVSGGIREEVQRAFVLHRFEQHLGGGALGIVVFSALFGAGHAIQGWDAVVATGLLGAFWGVLYLIRRSIAAPMVSHAGFDLAEIVSYWFR